MKNIKRVVMLSVFASLLMIFSACSGDSSLLPIDAPEVTPTKSILSLSPMPTLTPTQVRVLSQDQLESERLVIYKIAFQVIGAHSNDLLMDTTVNSCIGGYYPSNKQELPSLAEKTWDNFVATNSQNQPVQASIRDNLELSLISDAQLSEIWTSGNSYEFFSKKYRGANGIYYVSQIGFNNEFTQSIVMVGTYDIDLDELSGFAYQILLKYESGEWMEIERTVTCRA